MWFGGGERGKDLFTAPAQALRRNRWVHALRVEREGINFMVGRNATTYRRIKQVRLCLARVGVAQCG